MQLFFYANSKNSVDEDDFWEKSYLLRQTHQKLEGELSGPSFAKNPGIGMNEKREVGQRESILMSSSLRGKEQSIRDLQACPLFIKDIAKSILSAGKSLQLIRHIPLTSSALSGKGSDSDINDGLGSSHSAYHGQSIAGLTLSEILCVSLAGLIGHGDYVSRYLCQEDWYKQTIVPSFEYFMNKQKVENRDNGSFPTTCSEKIWYKLLVDTLEEKRLLNGNQYANKKEEKMAAEVVNRFSHLRPFCPENPVITVCQMILPKNRDTLKTLNLSRNLYLPSLNDEVLRKAIFGKESGPPCTVEGTDYTFGFQFGESEYIRSKDDSKMLEVLFPFPTLLPSFQVLLYDRYMKFSLVYTFVEKSGDFM